MASLCMIESDCETEGDEGPCDHEPGLEFDDSELTDPPTCRTQMDQEEDQDDHVDDDDDEEAQEVTDELDQDELEDPHNLGKGNVHVNNFNFFPQYSTSLSYHEASVVNLITHLTNCSMHSRYLLKDQREREIHEIVEETKLVLFVMRFSSILSFSLSLSVFLSCADTGFISGCLAAVKGYTHDLPLM